MGAANRSLPSGGACSERTSVPTMKMGERWTTYRVSNTEPLSDTSWQCSAFIFRIAQIYDGINSSNHNHRQANPEKPCYSHGKTLEIARSPKETKPNSKMTRREINNELGCHLISEQVRYIPQTFSERPQTQRSGLPACKV